MTLGVKKVAHEVVELAHQRVAALLPGAGRTVEQLMVNAYLQGAVDGSQVEAARSRKRGTYKPRASKP